MVKNNVICIKTAFFVYIAQKTQNGIKKIPYFLTKTIEKYLLT